MPEIGFYQDARGDEQVADYLFGLQRSGEKSVLVTFGRGLDLLGERGSDLGMPYSRIIDRAARMFELRFGDHRVAYVQRGDKIVLLHAWRKRSRKLDRREANRARARLEELE